MSHSGTSLRVAWRFAVVFLLLPVLSLAATTVRVYDVAVAGRDSVPALQEAMRQALVRATGRRDAGTDPALAGIVAGAQKYVQLYRPAPGGGTQVVFDGAALDRVITAAGRVLWPRERPFTLIVLQPAPTGAAADAARRTLEQAAESRGLPVSVAPLPQAEAGADTDSEALLVAAQRLGGDAVLLGRGDEAALNGQWQWTLVTPLARETWTGALDAGVHGAVDILARAEQATASQPEAEALVEVAGVQSLADYAAVGRLLGAIGGVRRVAMEEASGTSIVYRLLVRGGADAVDRGLASSGKLVRTGAANARLQYRYRE